MSRLFTAGETKVRPGVYKRYSNSGASNNTGSALNGVIAIVLQAPWGPVGAVTTHTKESTIREMYGECTGVEVAAKAVEAANAIGIEPKVHIVRMEGSGGVCGTATIGSVASVTAKYPGAYPLTVKVQEKLSDSTKKEVIILSGTTQKEKLEFTANAEGDVDAFVAALANSAYVTAEKTTDGVVSAQEVSLAGGVTPTCTTEDYLTGCEALEPYKYNVIVTDSVDAAVSTVIKNYVDAAFVEGKNTMAVIGSLPSVALSERNTAAKAMNDEKVIYFGSGYLLADGTIVEGPAAMGYVAGAIASTPSNQSIVHLTISGAVDVTEKLTNAEYENAISNGLLLLSVGPNGEIWFDSGINTLTSLAENQDEGWKKIKRTKVRHELFDRMDQVLEPKVGKVNCDADGISYIIQSGNDVINAMISEGGKIKSGSMELNTNDADSAWFDISVVDIDSLEKIYLHYHFKFNE